jgi:hypothetical protein
MSGSCCTIGPPPQGGTRRDAVVDASACLIDWFEHDLRQTPPEARPGSTVFDLTFAIDDALVFIASLHCRAARLAVPVANERRPAPVPQASGRVRAA